MDKVISVLKRATLYSVDSLFYPWNKTYRDVSQDSQHMMVGGPFVCQVYYADGSYSDFVFNNGFIYFESDLTEETYMVPTSDLGKRIMDALGINDIDQPYTTPC